MFINLSNGPSSSWEKERLRAASPYGKITDMPFPVIPPDWDTGKYVCLTSETRFIRFREYKLVK